MTSIPHYNPESSSPMEDEPQETNFSVWQDDVDALLRRVYHISLWMLPDAGTRMAFDEGQTPAEFVEEMFDGDWGVFG